jgi:methylated-DNA-[protein]-cysteine S-methyltransferase
VILASHHHSLIGVWFEGQTNQPDLSGWSLLPQHPILHEAIAQLQEYIQGRRQQFTLPLDSAQGTPFQRAVWNAIDTIAFGNTGSYQHIAHQIGRPLAVRAVASAVACNPWIVVRPCHRIIGRNGQLCGYAAGLAA